MFRRLTSLLLLEHRSEDGTHGQVWSVSHFVGTLFFFISSQVAAVDNRVVAAIPIVMPIGNVVANIGAEYKAYGNFSFALQPYLDQQITNYLYRCLFWVFFFSFEIFEIFASSPGVQDIANVVDPIVYINRYTFPIFSVSACGDEFTLPDSPRFWYSQLPGPKFLRVIPNAEHTLADVILNVVRCAMCVDPCFCSE
jgi:PhoPQ-activated pathogenicity-related protein